MLPLSKRAHWRLSLLAAWALCAPVISARAQVGPPANAPATPANPATAPGQAPATAPDDKSPVPVPVGDAPVAAPGAAPGDGAPVATTIGDATKINVTTKGGQTRRPLTPEERRQQAEGRLRAAMLDLGITAAVTQDAIIVYLAEDEMGRAGLRDAEKRLLTGVRRDVPPERMRDLLNDCHAATESYKAKRVSAQRKLDARVGYSLDPKLEARLLLMGVLGDGISKLPTAALVTPKADAAPDGTAPEGAAPKPNPPIYGPPVSPNFGARGEIVGTVVAKGITEKGEHWLEIRDDSGALDRYAALWREDLGALDPEVEAQIERTALSARVRVKWVWQERRRAIDLQPEDKPPPTPVRAQQ